MINNTEKPTIFARILKYLRLERNRTSKYADIIIISIEVLVGQ